MSYYFRDRPRFCDRLRGSSGDDFMEALGRQLDQESKSFFEPTTGRTSRERDPFDRHTGFSRGFPFDDDDDFESRGNIRSHLDDLAARHPEFADQLLGPPWGDTPFLGTRRNRRRGSGLGSYHSHPDEDARSQASGSSAGSAASGASGVSSHGDPEAHATSPQETQDFERQKERRRNPIPQYGLRNTVDIGQHRHNMENPDKMNRGQRSASAPPENRQQQQYYPPPQQQQQQPTQPQQQTQQQTPNPNQRFVSRVDITPQQQPPSSDNTKPPVSPKTPQQKSAPHQQSPPQHTQQQRPQQQPQSNVRHIPIFVEGRDEPVISRKTDDTPFPSSQQRPHSPPQFQTSSQFHRPSHFNQHFANRQQPWPPQFHQPQYEQQGQQTQQPERPNHYQQQQQQYRQQQAENHRAQQQQQQHQQEAEPPKLKQVQPKDPLEKVALVQNEVDSLMDQVKQFSGNSRQAKDYMYLDEMLTRELIKLDDIETEGKENVRQARKDAIKSIQNCIALLESKVPLPEQEQQMPVEGDEDKTSQQMETADSTTNVPGPETLESQNGTAPIPLPPAPSSPVTNSSTNPGEENPQVPLATTTASPDAQTSSSSDACPRVPAEATAPVDESTTEACVPPSAKSTEGDEPMATESAAPLAKTSSVTAMDVQEGDAMLKSQPDSTESQPAQEARDQSMEAADNVKPAKSKKKNQKTKLPKPVSEEPIPLPAPEVSQSSVN